MEVSLHLRHAIQDFTYSDNYLEDYCNLPKEEGGAGGAGCERHEFSHLDCPLEEDSGIFVFMKFTDDEETAMHISAFRIPVRHTLYIPSGVIHTNDYLKGTWRTMLSDAGPPIDHVHLCKGGGSGKVAKFSFTFKGAYLGHNNETPPPSTRLITLPKFHDDEEFVSMITKF